MSALPCPHELFSTSLGELYSVAGRPDLASLVRQGTRQVPPVQLKIATLHEWLTGKSIPSKAKHPELRFLVEYLEGQASARDAAHARRGWPWWAGQRQIAETARKKGTGTVAALHHTATSTVPTILNVVDDTFRTALATMEGELKSANEQIIALEQRETTLLDKLAAAVSERDRYRAELDAARLDQHCGSAISFGSSGSPDQSLVDQIDALVRRRDEADVVVRNTERDLAQVRARLDQQLAIDAALRPRRDALAAAGPYLHDVSRHNRNLTQQLGGALLALTAGAILLPGVDGGYHLTALDLATPAAAVIIVAESVYRGRWSLALTPLIPTLMVSWLLILVHGSHRNIDARTTPENIVSPASLAGLMVTLVIMVLGIRQRDRTLGAAAPPWQRFARTGIVALSAVVVFGALCFEFLIAPPTGMPLYRLLSVPATLAIAWIVAQTLWQHDLSARLTAAAAALLYVLASLAGIALSGTAIGATERSGLFAMFAVLAAAAAGALLLANHARRAPATPPSPTHSSPTPPQPTTMQSR